ncbi:MAG: DEAD/DEAH box helicase [Terricaulis sp.]
MALKTVFVGINKYRDPGVPELSGAKSDALALWALFSDTFQDLSARLLLDDDATCADVTTAMLDTLVPAGPDDTVVISFAGHGAPDGSLVLADTEISRLAETALPMTRLADAFKASKARAILCVLDCCFSGRAPARVLETEAKPRSALMLSDIAGEGRILLAACTADQTAWEQPGTGHGLLTYAIVQALTDADAGTINFPDVAGEIIRYARVEGERIGVVQTPMFLGSVTGGLSFPVLQRGENFRASFPSNAVRQMTGAMEEFAAHGFPEAIVTQWREQFPAGLNALQVKAVNDFGVLEGKDLLVVAPTSSGKTLIGEIAAIQAVAAGKKAAFLLPYRALVNEKFDDFSARYGAAGLRVMRCSGDATDGIGVVLNGRYDLAFFTYETFLNLALGSPRLLAQLGLVVVDEGQFITDPNRGISVELIFALMLRAQERGVRPQKIILSAVIGKLNGFDRWLDLPVLSSNERPVPLIEGVLDRRGVFQSVGVDGATKTEQMLDPYAIVQRRDKPSSQDVIVPLAKKLIAAGEKLIVFRNTRGPAQGCARYLAKELGLSAAQSVLDVLPTHDLTGASVDLRLCLEGGTAFHNTNLLRAEREAVERGYRAKDGGIHALASTTTLAAGINTPASTVILAENEFVGDDGRPFTIAEYKNMAGRAGRLGYNEIGKAIILADTGVERAQLFQRYVLGKPEDVTSSFKLSELRTWTLRLLSQVRGVRAEDIPTLLVNTFGGYIASRDNPGWVARVEVEIGRLVERLLSAGLAETEGELIHLTLLGRACGSSSLSFESSLRLIEIMRPLDPEATPPHQVLALIQVLQEMDDTYTPVFKKGQAESVRASDAAERYGRDVLRPLQRYVREDLDFVRRCKRAAILFDWIEGVPVDAIEKKFTTTPFQGAVFYGDIVRIAESARFRLRSARQILGALIPDKSAFLGALDELLPRLEYGVPAEALRLVGFKTPLTRGQYLALYQLGCRSADDILGLDRQSLADAVGAVLAATLKPAA